MGAPPRARMPQAVLFACGLNSVRSPMAESLLRHMFPQALYVKSAGVRKRRARSVRGRGDGGTRAGHFRPQPMTFEELDDWEGLNFDLIITLSPEAHHKALELTRRLAADVEYWPTQDPTDAEGNRAQKLEAYREVCDGLLLRIRNRFFEGRGREWLTLVIKRYRESGNSMACSLSRGAAHPSPFDRPPPLRGCLREALPIGSARIRPESSPSKNRMLGRPKFVLASGSPRRLSLLNQAGIEPDALRPADVDETPRRGELPRACANRLARAKADAALKSVQLDDELRGAFILAADTVVAVGPPHPAESQSGRRSLAMPAAAVGAQPSGLHRGLPGDTQGDLSPAPDRVAGALQTPQRGTISRPILAPANGAAKPAATPCRASPDRSWSRWSAPTPISSACRSMRRSRCSAAKAFRFASAG